MTRVPARQERSQRSIASILDSAEQLIGEAGQIDFTASSLASRAGMSIGRLYYWYPDLGAVLEAVLDRLLADVPTAPAAEPIEAVARLCATIEQHPAFIVLAVAGSPASRRRVVDAITALVYGCTSDPATAAAAVAGALLDYHRVSDIEREYLAHRVEALLAGL